MSKTKRILVYLGGFFIGMVLVSMITTRRTMLEERRPDPWLEHNQKMLEAGAAPLPDSAHSAIQKGVIIDFGYLPDATSAEQMVWLLKFEDSYPYVRVVQDVNTQKVSYMAADQISIQLAEDADVTALEPMLDELGLRLRMFNRKEQLAIISVLNTDYGAVPATIAAVQPWADLFVSVEPDWLRFQPKKPGE
ncbi:MAG: hypothetical protein ACON4O_06300 [Lentimonas sp.]